MGRFGQIPGTPLEHGMGGKRTKIGVLTTILAWGTIGVLLATQPAIIDEFKGLDRFNPPDKVIIGGHTLFDNAFLQGSDKSVNLQVVKGRTKLNTTAHTDLVKNGLFYYESSTGTKKIIVAESDELVSYDTDGTNRTSIANTLTNERWDAIQVGDTLYLTSTTNGLYKWTGTGSATAVGSVAAPSSVNFSATAVVGGLTPGLDALLSAIAVSLNDFGDSINNGTCNGDLAMYQTTSGTHQIANTACTSVSSTYFNKVCATTTDYKYKITKYSTLTGIESEPSSADTATLTGGNTINSTPSGTCYIAYSDAVCTSASGYNYCTDDTISATGKETSTSGTLTTAPSAPFDSYRIYRTVAGGSDYFLLGDQTTGTYTDGTVDTALSTPLDTTIDTISPPALRYIAEYKGVLFVGEGNGLNFTRLPIQITTDADTYWLNTDTIKTGAIFPITGLHTTANSLLIFTSNRILELTGFGVDSFRLKTLEEKIGTVSDETIETDVNGDIIFFAGTAGVYKLNIGRQATDDLFGATSAATSSKIIRISSPVLENVFNGVDTQIVLSPSDYANSHAYYSVDDDLYYLYIGEHCFIYDNSNNTWSHVPGAKFNFSLYRKSPGLAGQGVLTDNLGFFYNNWTTYANAVPSGTVTGSPTSSTSVTLVDSTATFYTTGSGLAGTWVIKDNGSTLEYRRITGNSATSLTVESAWTVNPLTTDTYYIGYIVFDILTKQYNFSKAPRESMAQTFTVAHEKSTSAQNLRIRNYVDKGTTYIDTQTFNVATQYIDKFGFQFRGTWLQWGLRAYVYNTSSTVVAPIDIINYSFRGTEYGED